MFSGIIDEIGVLQEIIPHENGGITWHISCSFLKDLNKGDSISISGVCHTIEQIHDNFFQVFSSQQTLKNTSLGEKKAESPINLERSLQLGSRINGHFVYGHIDFASRVVKIHSTGKSKVFDVSFPSEYRHFLVLKGSVTLDGVSLTILDFPDDQSFSVAIIPHTLENTTLNKWHLFSHVNVELDMLGKYVINTQPEKPPEKKLDLQIDLPPHTIESI